MEWNVTNILCALLFMLFDYSAVVNSTDPEVKFIPTNYKLKIGVEENHFGDGDTSEMKFSGEVTIDIDMKNPDNFQKNFSIILNADSKMTFEKVILKGLVKDSSNNYEEIKYLALIHSDGMLHIKCKKEDVREKFQLTIGYQSEFGNDMTGFYRSSYKDSANKKRWLLTTHFEPIFARKAFPCFDQPNLKAFFEIEIVTPENIKTVLSNTNLKNTIKEKGKARHIFTKTKVPMSTYLVAFTASDFTATVPVEFKSNYGSETAKKLLKTYGRKDIIDKGDASLAQIVGKAAIEGLTQYLDLGYAFDKIDLVGIPDFSAGAMENWGHISFREKSLFFNKSSNSVATEQANVLTITHELVHQWFGNLVTLKSWDYIWLNEAFANYLEFIIASKFSNPDTSKWQLMDQLVVNEIHLRAFETDGLNSSTPLNNKISDESLIYSSFNDIPYSKGAAVLRMWDLEFKEKFQESLKKYLKDRKESSVASENLFQAFKEVAKMTDKTFKSWTDQAGYPVVEVHKSKNTYKLNQTRFFWESISGSENWRIPITYSTDKNSKFSTEPLQWLEDKPIEITENCTWIIVNNQQAGYYRVNYDKENWHALSSALSQKDFSNIPEVNRAQIINDVFSLARSLQKQYVEYSIALNLAKYLKNEKSFIAIKTALNAFEFLQTKLYKESVYDNFKEYVLNILKPHFKTLNSIGLGHVEKLKNIEISRRACLLDYEPCVKESKVLFNDSSYDKYPDTKEIVLCTVVRNDVKNWENVFNKYKNEDDSALKLMYISALGCTNDVATAEKFLNKTLGSNPEIRQQDRINVLSSVYNGNSKNIETAFKFIEKNFKEIATKFGGINPLGKALVGIAKKLNTKNEVTRLETLVKSIEEIPEGKSAADSIKNALKIARGNVDWIEKRMPVIREYLNSGSFMSYSFVLLLLSHIFVFQF